MKNLNEDIRLFFQDQGFAIVSTIDRDGLPHNSCKGIVNMTKTGLIYLMDVYWGRTYSNLLENPAISITAVDERRFIGYCLKGKAKIVKAGKLKPRIIKAWEKKLASRITQRLIKNIQGDKAHPWHPEALLPKPAYLILMQVRQIVDLTPQSIK